MSKVKTRPIVAFFLVSSFLFSCSKNVPTTPLSTDQNRIKRIEDQKKLLAEFLEKQKLSSKLDPRQALFKEAYEFYKKAKQSAKYPGIFDIYGTEDLKSIEFLEQAIAINPYYHAAYYVLGLCYSRAENYKKAEECFLKSIKFKPKYQDGYTKLANIYKKQNRLDEALNFYDKSLRAGPPNGSILSNIGETYLKKGDLAKAETFYLKILKLDKDKKLYFPDIASFYLKKGNLKESWKYLKKSIISWESWEDKEDVEKKLLEPYKPYLSEDNFYAHVSVGFIYYFLGKWKEAKEHFERALKLNRSEFDQHYRLGMSYKSIGNYKKAVLYLEEALKRSPNHYDTNLQLGIIYGLSSIVAYVYKTKTDYKRSVELLEKASQIDPENPSSYYYLGKTYLEMEKYYEALRETRKALNIQKDVPILNQWRILDQMGAIYTEMKDYKMALEYYSKSLEVYDNCFTRYDIIEALINLKDYDKARDFIKRSIDACPQHKLFKIKLGDVFFEEGKYLSAIQLYEDYLKKENPNDPYVLFYIALSHQKLKNWDESEFWWKKAIEIDPEDWAACYNLGLVYYYTSKYDKAIKNFNKCLELNPKDNDAKRMIETCQYQIDLEKLPEKLRKLSLRNDNIGKLSLIFLCIFDYDKANSLLIEGTNETEYKDGRNIVSSKIFEAQGLFEKIKSDLEKIGSSNGQTKKIVDLFLFAADQKIKGIELQAEGYYVNISEYKGQYEKGFAKIRLADKYFNDCLKILSDEILNNKSIFGDIAYKLVKLYIEYYEKKYNQ